MAEESFDNPFLDTPQANTGLMSRVVRGGFWVFALRITTRLFGLARTIVLARLLAPAQFGLFGIALLAMSALEVFSQTGFNVALVQKKGNTKPYLDTAWTVQVIRGILLALIAFAIAPYVATFFDAPAAKPILQVIACSVLLGGFTNIGVVYFQKELKFHKQFIYMFSGTLADIGVAISAAFLLRNAWALVLGLLAGNFVRVVVSYSVHHYRPRLRFNQQQFKELFGFGKWILGTSIVVFLANQGDHILVGKLLGAAALGFYQVAYRFSNIITTEISHVVSQVTFPAYSKLQDNLPKLREGFFKTLEVVASVSLPLTAGIFILAPDFVRLFLGEKWMPMVPALRILSISGLIRSIAKTGGPLFIAVGRPNMDFWMNLGRFGVMATAIYPLTKLFGINGSAIAAVLAISATIPVWWYVSSNIIKSDYKQFSRSLLPSLAGTGVMSLFILITVRMLVQIGFLEFGFCILIPVIVYVTFQFFLCKRFGYGLVGGLQILKRPLIGGSKGEDCGRKG